MNKPVEEMSREELEIALICEKNAKFDEIAKYKRFMEFLKIIENDMDFEPTTELEFALKDQLKDIIKEAHKQFN